MKTHHYKIAIFSQTVNWIEKLLAAINVPFDYHNVTLLLTSHGRAVLQSQLMLFGYFFVYTVACIIQIQEMQLIYFF